jgi:tryptophan synthase alpha subunit
VNDKKKAFDEVDEKLQVAAKSFRNLEDLFQVAKRAHQEAVIAFVRISDPIVKSVQSNNKKRKLESYPFSSFFLISYSFMPSRGFRSQKHKKYKKMIGRAKQIRSKSFLCIHIVRSYKVLVI